MSSRYLPLAFCVPALFLSSAVANAQAVGGATNAPAAAAPAKAPDVEVDPHSQAIGEAMAKMATNDVDGAIAKLTVAIQTNPKDSIPFVLRASAYCQKKMWTEAETDFKSAQQLDPTNAVIKFNVVEVKYMQKQYDAARAGYASMVKDPEMGDLAAYKVFLCDLLAGHEELAQKERDAFDPVESKPSYYFSRAAWDLSHKNEDSARSWLVSVASIFPSAKISYYALPLKDLGWLPIPPPHTVENTLSAPSGQ